MFICIHVQEMDKGMSVNLMTNASDLLQILAAHRYGIKRVILPERNLKDLVEVPSAVLASLEVRCNA